MTVSIIIAVKTWQKNLENCVARCLELDYSDFEIIILPDELFDEKLLFLKGTIPVRVIPTGQLKPGDKRDIGLKHSKGEIIAFLDDDAYPVGGWLKTAIEDFSDPEVAAVGGPAITPVDDNLMQKASGRVYSSLLVSGNFVYRYVPGKRRLVDDLPSCNLLVRRSAIEAVGGFDTKYWPGEDTKLCLDIVKKLGKIIIYDPRVLVYHHRRTLFRQHLMQIASYALHRGYFVKKYPQTSCKPSYFIPSLFVIGLAFGSFIPALMPVYNLCLWIYLFLCLVCSFSGRSFKLWALVFLGTISTHITYGIFFIKGLIIKKL